MLDRLAHDLYLYAVDLDAVMFRIHAGVQFVSQENAVYIPILNNGCGIHFILQSALLGTANKSSTNINAVSN